MASPFKMHPKSPMMKALKGNQHKLPDHLKKAIKAAPEDSPAKSYGSPVKKTDKPMSRKEIEANQKTMDYRRGKGRATVTKRGSIVKGSSSQRLGEGMAPTGSKKAGSAGRRSIKEGRTASGKRTGRSQTVVLEKTASQIKKRGVDLKTKGAKGKSPAKSYGSKKKSPMMKKGVKGLKMQRGKK